MGRWRLLSLSLAAVAACSSGDSTRDEAATNTVEEPTATEAETPEKDPERMTTTTTRGDPCSPYTYQHEAQAVLDSDPSDPEGLDPNRNGRACDTLASPDLSRVFVS